MTDNEDKIKVLEKAVTYLADVNEFDNYVGICDGINYGVRELDLNHDVFGNAKFYGIELPERKYPGSTFDCPIFSYPCTPEGKQQRIEVLKEAIKKIQS